MLRSFLFRGTSFSSVSSTTTVAKNLSASQTLRAFAPTRYGLLPLRGVYALRYSKGIVNNDVVEGLDLSEYEIPTTTPSAEGTAPSATFNPPPQQQQQFQQPGQPVPPPAQTQHPFVPQQHYQLFAPQHGAEYMNISQQRFDDETCSVLMAPIDPNDVEVKPDGIIYLPEIKYRRILNQAFGPGGWAMMPRGEYILTEGFITQEYALFCRGQFVAQAWGEQPYNEGHSSGRSIATALEGAKSNALMRCCKDLGIASELWDPHYILEWKQKHTVEVWCSHVQGGKGKRKLVRRIDRAPFTYPWKEEGPVSGGSSNTSKQAETTAARRAKEAKAPILSADLEMPADDINPAEIVGMDTATLDDEPFMFDSLIGGDMEESVLDPPTSRPAASSGSGGGFTFDLQNKVGFGKHRETKWADLLATKDGVNYVNYMLKQRTLNANLRSVFEQAQKYLHTKRRP